MPTPSANAPRPTQAQMLAEAYRRGLMRPAQAAAYEAAALRGTINDPYAAGRADERSSARGTERGASLSFTSSIPFLNDAGAGLSAGVGALDNMFHRRPADYGGQWNRARALQQGYQDQYAADHPLATTGLKAGGLAAQMAAALGTGGASEAAYGAAAARGGLAATTRRVAATTARNATRGGTVAAINAAAQPGTLRQRVAAADNAFLPGAAMGAALPAVVAAAPGMATAARRAAARLAPRMAPPPVRLPSPAGALINEGIPVTLGQRLGGPMARAENQAVDLPVLGAAIRTAQASGREGLNRALANRALAQIGEALPARIPVGPPAADYINAKVAAAREGVLDRIESVEPDAQYARDVQEMLAKADRALPEDLREHFDSVVDRAGRHLTNGPANSETLKDLFYHLDGAIDDHIDSPNPMEDAYSLHLQNFKDRVAALVGRQNPGFMEDYAGGERAKLIADLFSDATNRAAGDANGFSASHLLQAHDAVPASHITDLVSSVMPSTLDLADRAHLIMEVPRGSGASGPSLLGAGLGAAALPNAFAAGKVAQTFANPATLLAQPNAFSSDLAPALTAAAGVSAAATAARSRRRPVGAPAGQ